MSPTQEQEAGPRLTERELTDFFAAAEQPDPREHKIGTEMEKFGVAVDPRTGLLEPVRFREHVVPVLEALRDRFAWQPVPSGLAGALVELRRDGASITLEPGGQLELSGRPLADAHASHRELVQHQRELHQVSEPLGITWMAAGFHPWARRDEFDWMPKGRYAIMREYLPTRGPLAHDMMLRTSTIQANFDYASETQCGERLRLSLLAGPIVAALFANSPYEEGRFRGQRTLRPQVWAGVDPDRCGIPAPLLERPFSYRRYVEWALDVPMFFVHRDGRYLPFHRPFRAFMAQGFVDPEGRHHHATQSDWALHLSTVFPGTRLKPFVEVRQADAGPLPLSSALPALWKGLLYDPIAGERALWLLGEPTVAELVATWQRAGTVGLGDPVLRQQATGLVSLSQAALERADVRDASGRSEAELLAPLVRMVEQGKTLADETLELLGESPGRDEAGRRRLADHYWFAGARP